MFASISGRVNTLLLMLLLVVGVATVVVLARSAGAGPLDPPGAPASTMKSLDEVPGSWSRVLSASNGAPSNSLFPPGGCNSDRFKCVMQFQNCGQVCITEFPAVLDEETGLVWERKPSTSAQTWISAWQACHLKKVGNRYGWRMPSIEEAESLLDETGGIPVKSPFIVDFSDQYFTSTTAAFDSGSAYVLTGGGHGVFAKDVAHRVWCVRGDSSDVGF